MFWEINHFISKSLNNFVIENNLQSFVGVLADLPIFFIPIFLVFTWLYYTFKNKNLEKKKELVLIFFAPVIGIAINLVIQQIVHIPRPETFVTPILSHVPDASFPSDHAVVSFAFLFSLYFFGYRKLFFLYLPFVILMNFSRIAGGLHWFWDVFTGFVIALFVSYFIWKFRNSKFLDNFSSFFVKFASCFKL